VLSFDNLKRAIAARSILKCTRKAWGACSTPSRTSLWPSNGPGYTFTVTSANGKTMNWHEAAQAHLEATGLRVANASLVYSLCAVLLCWIMLWFLWRKRIFLKVCCAVSD
jgi:hypothetical protein